MRDDDEDDRIEQRRQTVRRWVMVGVVIVVFVAAILAIRWVGQTLGLGRIGEFYQQAGEEKKP